MHYIMPVGLTAHAIGQMFKLLMSHYELIRAFLSYPGLISMFFPVPNTAPNFASNSAPITAIRHPTRPSLGTHLYTFTRHSGRHPLHTQLHIPFGTPLGFPSASTRHPLAIHSAPNSLPNSTHISGTSSTAVGTQLETLRHPLGS